jgi:hypothetical protein
VSDFFTVFAVLMTVVAFSLLNDLISDFSLLSVAHTLGSICFLGLTLLAGPLTNLVAYPSQISNVVLLIATTLFLFIVSLRWPNKLTRICGVVGSILWMVSGLAVQM